MRATRRVQMWVAVVTAAGGALVFSGCGGNPDKVEVQRKLVRAETTSTPRPEKGKPKPKSALATPKAVKSANFQKSTATPTHQPPRNAPQGSPARVMLTACPPMPRKATVLVTSHTLAQIEPRAAKDYRIEGSGLGTCRLYLRRYGVETELVPTTRSDSLIEFARAEWLFLAAGAYDLVLRDADGSELILPQAARVE